jgi:hypothetical protein
MGKGIHFSPARGFGVYLRMTGCRGKDFHADKPEFPDADKNLRSRLIIAERFIPNFWLILSKFTVQEDIYPLIFLLI